MPFGQLVLQLLVTLLLVGHQGVLLQPDLLQLYNLLLLLHQESLQLLQLLTQRFFFSRTSHTLSLTNLQSPIFLH